MTVLRGGHHTAPLLSSLKNKTISGWLWSRSTSRSSEGVGSLMLGAWLGRRASVLSHSRGPGLEANPRREDGTGPGAREQEGTGLGRDPAPGRREKTRVRGGVGRDPGRGCRRGRGYGRGPRHRCDGIGAGRKERTRAGKLEGFRRRGEPPPQLRQRKFRPGSGRPPPLHGRLAGPAPG